MATAVEAGRLLGPRRCAISIIWGNSDDGTADILRALELRLESDLGTKTYFGSSDVDPLAPGGKRIGGLVELRSLALEPMLSGPDRHRLSSSPNKTTVVFINDVAACVEDVLELVHQRRLQQADMTCAMDWTYVGKDPTFYDVWVSRTLSGESFFQISESGSWDLGWNLLSSPGDAEAKEALMAHQQFQVFSCWNGMVVFDAAPVINREVSFRSARPGECRQGEPQLFCKDMWWRGHGKIAVVPTVNLEYSNERGMDIKDLKGHVSKYTGEEDWADKLIAWRDEPPDMVRYMDGFDNQSFEKWNVSLVSSSS